MLTIPTLIQYSIFINNNIIWIIFVANNSVEQPFRVRQHPPSSHSLSLSLSLSTMPTTLHNSTFAYDTILRAIIPPPSSHSLCLSLDQRRLSPACVTSTGRNGPRGCGGNPVSAMCETGRSKTA